MNPLELLGLVRAVIEHDYVLCQAGDRVAPRKRTDRAGAFSKSGYKAPFCSGDRPELNWYTRQTAGRLVVWLAITYSLAAAAQEPVVESRSEPVNPDVNIGWGLNLHNHRYQTASQTSITKANVHALQVKWVYGLRTFVPRSYPHVTADSIYIGDGASVVSLDRETGATRWQTETAEDVSTAIVRDGEFGTLLFYGAGSTEVGALDVTTGTHAWRTDAREVAKMPRYSGSPLAVDGVLYVPLSSWEIGLGHVPFYGCCRTRGGLIALDTGTGERLWHRPAIEEPAEPQGYAFLLVRRFAPSGAPVWSAPTVDVKRDRVYFATGQNYTRPTTHTSDAIFSVNTLNGEVDWVTQVTEGDAYNLACDPIALPFHCPDPPGPDVDFGGPPVLAKTAEGRELLFAGQKSSDVHALDPDTGEIVWTTNVGRGGLLGGVHFGVAVHPELHLVYAPVSDIVTDAVRGKLKANPGVHALDMTTGDVVWSFTREQRCPQRTCWPGMSATVLVTPEVVFAGGLDGLLLGLDAKTGEELWRFDANQSFETVNDRDAHGGAFDAHGPMVKGSQLMISSGYGSFGQVGGNAFLVFELNDE